MPSLLKVKARFVFSQLFPGGMTEMNAVNELFKFNNDRKVTGSPILLRTSIEENLFKEATS